MTMYGYCRISTPNQSIDRQERNIKKAYPETDGHIVKEAYSGRKIHRPKWDRLLKNLQAGDTVVFDSVSRMSRNADDGCKVYMELYNRGINLIFLKEPHINTSVYREAVARHIDITADTGREAVDKFLTGQGKLFNELMADLATEQVRLAFAQAQKEVDDLRQRTREGMLTAKLNGKQIGQKEGKQLTTKQGESVKLTVAKHSKDFGGSLSDADCMKLAGVARNTYYKHKKQLKALRETWAENPAPTKDKEGKEHSWREDLSEAEKQIVSVWDKNK